MIKETKLDDYCYFDYSIYKKTSLEFLSNVNNWKVIISDKDKVCIIGYNHSDALPYTLPYTENNKPTIIDKKHANDLFNCIKKDALKVNFKEFQFVFLNGVCDDKDASIAYEVIKRVTKFKAPNIIIAFCKIIKHYAFDKSIPESRKEYRAWFLARKALNYLEKKGYSVKLLSFKPGKEPALPNFLIACKDDEVLTKIEYKLLK